MFHEQHAHLETANAQPAMWPEKCNVSIQTSGTSGDICANHVGALNDREKKPFIYQASSTSSADALLDRALCPLVGVSATTGTRFPLRVHNNECLSRYDIITIKNLWFTM